MQNRRGCLPPSPRDIVPFGVTYEKIGTIQRRLAWPLHKDDTLSRSGRPTGLNIYALFAFRFYLFILNVETKSWCILEVSTQGRPLIGGVFVVGLRQVHGSLR